MARAVGDCARREDEQDGHNATFRFVPCILQITHLHSPACFLTCSGLHCAVAKDYFGNRFFENKSETYGRHRWVEYSEDRGYDSLRIPPDWHAWLHHNTDVVPTKRPLPKPEYHVPATGNKTGTPDAYVPDHHRLSKQFAGPSKEKYEVG